MASISVRVGAGTDDGYWASPSTFNNASSSINLGLSSNRSGFMRFTGLSALHGATILSATLTLRSDTNQSAAVTFNIAAAAADNVAAPSSASDCTSQTRTTAQVSWPISASWSSGTDYDSPDITSIIQEMASSGYLASGVALLYIEWTSGSNRRDVVSYNGSSSYAPMLYVEYSTTVDKSTTDASTASVDDAAAVSATLLASDASTVDVTEVASVEVVVTVSASDAATVAVDEAVVGIGVGATEATAVASVEGAAISVAAGVADDSTPIADEAVVGSTMLAADDAGAVGVSEATPAIALGATDASTVVATEVINRRVIPITYEPRLAVDVYDAAGNRLGAGPITGILAADYSGRLDELGSWSVTIDATEPAAALLTRGREIWLRREGEGLLFRGIVDTPDLRVGELDDRTLTATGRSIGAQMVHKNTLLGLTFSGDAVSSVVTTLLAGTGWTAGTIDSGTLASARFDGVSRWAALRQVAETMGWHVREDNLNRVVHLGEAGASSGLVIRNIQQPAIGLGVVPLASLRVTGDDPELWNVVVPLGAGEGINALTLEHSTRTAPYAIQTATGPDGNPYWYLRDVASVSAYGERTKVLDIDQVAPISNSAAEVEAAADTLYDIAAAWLGYHANPAEHYEADVALLRHIEAGSPTFLLGQTARLQYAGIVEDVGGRRAWRTIDTDVYIMGYRRTFQPDGSDRWQLELSTADQHAEGAADRIAKAIEDLWTIKVAMRPYTYREIHGPYRESVDSTHTATVTVDYDDAVTYLHRAELRLVKRKVRSNVSTAAAGGSPTSNATTIAANAGGGVTSDAGTSHTHSISAAVTSDDIGEHYHQIGQAQPTSSWTDPAYLQQMVFASSAGGGLDYGIYGGRNGTEGASKALWTSGFTFHKHNIAATATSAESSHKHTLPTHTHSINDHAHTIPPHTHSLNYGIYEGPAAGSPAFGIAINGTDRTSALGGPWNGDVVLDITPYLVDSHGHVLRQANSVVISSAQLCDVELTVKSFVSALSVVPV